MFAASVMQMPSPVPYEHRLSDLGASKNGMNFAVGGSGVFSPFGVLSLSGQIDQFQAQNYTRDFLQSSVVLLGMHGNDYGAYIAKGNPLAVSSSTMHAHVANFRFSIFFE